MQFIHLPLTWGFLLVLVPLLIHLINLMRQKRVHWAAMEFLLQSHRKHRQWVWLKQLLLLLLRMLAIAAVVAMLAGLVTQDQWSLLGGQTTHHYLVLDDSVSMADRGSTGSAFDRATAALKRIAEQLASQPTSQKVTLLRTSRATKATPNDPLTDMNAVLVDGDFAEAMEVQNRQLEATELVVGPTAALSLVEQLIKDAPERSRQVYLLSDFRAQEWDAATELRETLRRIRKANGQVHLIRCTEEDHANIAITDVTPEPGTRAAGVPLLVNVKLKNFGLTPAQQVTVRLSARSFPTGVLVSDDQQVPEEQVTTVLVESIPAGEVAVRQAQFKFDRAGEHLIEARLTSDAFLPDNLRRCLVDIPATIPVLVIDGGEQGREAFYLEAVFNPGRVVTGIVPVRQPPVFLRDIADVELQRFAAIYLLDVEELDARAIRALDRYVRQGGGLAFFVGPNSDPRFLIDLYDDGRGLFPLPVQADREVTRLGSDTPDIQVNDHPIFRALIDEGGKNRPLTRQIRILRHLPPDPAWQPTTSGDTEVLATVQGVEPLVVAKQVGQGHVVAFLTTASPTWNNWARGPTFPVVLLQLQGFLSMPRQFVEGKLVGEPLELQLDAAQYKPEVEFHAPYDWRVAADVSDRAAPSASTPDSADTTKPTSRGTTRKAPDNSLALGPLLRFTLGEADSADSGATDRSGVYVARTTSLEGESDQRRFVLNVSTEESNLAVIPRSELADQLDELQVDIHSADELEYEATEQDGFSWSQFLMGLLVVMLLGEQVLAYSASYHPKGGER